MPWSPHVVTLRKVRAAHRQALCRRVVTARVWIASDHGFDAKSFHTACNLLSDCAAGKQADRARLQTLNWAPSLPLPIPGESGAVRLREFLTRAISGAMA